MITQHKKTLQTTNLQTLWTETLFEMLFDAVRNDWSANALMEIMKELNRKGYKYHRVVNRVRKKLGDKASSQLMRKIKGK
ncbi:MAG: hypothetical protein P8126_01315 [Gammaproteobacteria bacterium]